MSTVPMSSFATTVPLFFPSLFSCSTPVANNRRSLHVQPFSYPYAIASKSRCQDRRLHPSHQPITQITKCPPLHTHVALHPHTLHTHLQGAKTCSSSTSSTTQVEDSGLYKGLGFRQHKTQNRFSTKQVLKHFSYFGTGFVLYMGCYPCTKQIQYQVQQPMYPCTIILG